MKMEWKLPGFCINRLMNRGNHSNFPRVGKGERGVGGVDKV